MSKTISLLLILISLDTQSFDGYFKKVVSNKNILVAKGKPVEMLKFDLSQQENIDFIYDNQGYQLSKDGLINPGKLDQIFLNNGNIINIKPGDGTFDINFGKDNPFNLDGLNNAISGTNSGGG